MSDDDAIVLVWQRFTSFRQARDALGKQPGVYVVSDPEGRPVRVGMTLAGLVSRYYGGTAWAIEAAGHGSGNLWFVAPVDRASCAVVEATMIWQWRDSLPYNVIGKKQTPKRTVTLRHKGKPPKLPNTN